MDIAIEKGTESDIGQLALLYDELNEFLENGINYPGWIKGVYPTREDAIQGVSSNTLYTARIAGKIVGSIILNHQPEPAYSQAIWKDVSDYSSIFVIHTFAVHPSFLKNGVGMKLMTFAIDHATINKATSIRLDVYRHNTPAIHLYEKCGFNYVDTVDLGLGKYGLYHFSLFEKML